MSRVYYWCGVILLAVAIAAVNVAISATPMQWVDSATYAGGSGNKITIAWQEGDDPVPDSYEIVSSSIEHPNQTRRWTFSKDQVSRVPASAPSLFDVSVTMKLPASGHYALQIRSCVVAGCTAWSNSQDPTVARVNGQPRGWWLYVFLDPPGGVIPLP